jgi:glycosyltransferase involved in cell wall biosynthesis
MKILQVLAGGAWGGASVVVLAITRALIARGDQVWVVCLDELTAERFREAGARTVGSRFWLRSISPLDLIPFVQLFRLCRRERFDLVVTHTSKGGVLGRLTARLAGVPSIIHIAHGYSFSEDVETASRKLYLAVEKIAARAGHLTVSVSEEHHRKAIELGVEKPETICTIHNGIDLTPFENARGAAARRSLNLGDGDIVIGTAGRLATQKGLEYLIRAMPHVLAKFSQARLVIAGQGPLDWELRELAQSLGVAQSVHLLGFRSDVPDLLAAFDIYVQPSLWEGLSISLIEGMAARRPIVATNIRGNREQIEDGVTGLMVPPRDPIALADAICRLLVEPELAEKLRANAYQVARERFSEMGMVQRHLAVYDRLVQQRRLGRQCNAQELDGMFGKDVFHAPQAVEGD